MDIDWANLEFYQYLAIGGGALAVLALMLYFLLPKGLKVPAGVISTLAALVAGLGLGVMGMAAFGYQTQKEGAAAAGGPPPEMKGPGGFPGGMPGGGMPGKGPPGGGGGGKGKGKGFGGFGPSPKTQLANLVTKMNKLTEKPLTLTLSEDQRTAVHEQLKGLADLEELEDDDAKKRLDAILESITDQKQTLEAAGYNWPGGGGGFQPPAFAPPNPFKGGPGADNLAALEQYLAKKK